MLDIEGKQQEKYDKQEFISKVKGRELEQILM